MEIEFKEIKNLVNQIKFDEAHERIRNLMEIDPENAPKKGRQVDLAHWLILAADWQLINKIMPMDLNFLLSSGWLRSLYLKEPVNTNRSPIPWITYPAIDFLEQKIQKDWTVFEWGSGNSTLWWSERVKYVHAVESNKEYYEKFSNDKKDNIMKDNIMIKLCEDEDSYINAIETSQFSLFDVVVIDGDSRNLCAKKAVEHVKDDGIIVFDNSDRSAYQDGINYITDFGWMRIDFFGMIPCYTYKSCTSIFLK
ncbi:MAG: class I SAM-dependent methyltransferase, partial [Rhodospirillales bacterium]|nr:class I SAM-dependent methyltransferase [Rhodospirillales bacterium]